MGGIHGSRGPRRTRDGMLLNKIEIDGGVFWLVYSMREVKCFQAEDNFSGSSIAKSKLSA